jgi:chromosome segregation ATPase
MPAKPTPWDLTKEEMDAIQDRFGDLQHSLGDVGARLVDFITEMLTYKKDVDGQIAKQFSMLEEAKAIRDAIIEVNKAQESWLAQSRANDKGHDDKIAALVGQANALDGLIKGLQQSLASLGSSLTSLSSTVSSANSRQDDRLNQLEAGLKGVIADVATLKTQQGALLNQVAELDQDTSSHTQTLEALAKSLLDLEKRVKALEEPTPKEPPTEEPPKEPQA